MFLTGIAYCQTNLYPSDRDNKMVLELSYMPDQKTALPVKEIEILDARYEQSFIGATTGKDMLLENEFTIEGGELTPTLKVKRRVIDQKYKDVIEKLYEE